MELRTDRLLLRPHREGDIPALVELLNDRRVAENTLRIPHPYTGDDARRFFRQSASAQGVFGFLICLLNTRRLVGGIGLHVEDAHRRAELGYWIGHPFWGNGYATEAAREVIRYGFEELKLNRIFAGVFGGNDASVRVLEKVGMKYEGTAREHFLKWGRFLDDLQYAILASDWKALHL